MLYISRMTISFSVILLSDLRVDVYAVEVEIRLIDAPDDRIKS